jgi:hypothetical protein
VQVGSDGGRTAVLGCSARRHCAWGGLPSAMSSSTWQAGLPYACQACVWQPAHPPQAQRLRNKPHARPPSPSPAPAHAQPQRRSGAGQASIACPCCCRLQARALAAGHHGRRGEGGRQLTTRPQCISLGLLLPHGPRTHAGCMCCAETPGSAHSPPPPPASAAPRCSPLPSCKCPLRLLPCACSSPS